LPGYEFVAWHVLLGPKGMPGPVVALLSDNLKKILLAPGQPQHYADRGLDVIASTPEECATYLKNEMRKWGKVIKERGMRADGPPTTSFRGCAAHTPGIQATALIS